MERIADQDDDKADALTPQLSNVLGESGPPHWIPREDLPFDHVVNVRIYNVLNKIISKLFLHKNDGDGTR